MSKYCNTERCDEKRIRDEKIGNPQKNSFISISLPKLFNCLSYGKIRCQTRTLPSSLVTSPLLLLFPSLFLLSSSFLLPSSFFLLPSSFFLLPSSFFLKSLFPSFKQCRFLPAYVNFFLKYIPLHPSTPTHLPLSPPSLHFIYYFVLSKTPPGGDKLLSLLSLSRTYLCNMIS